MSYLRKAVLVAAGLLLAAPAAAQITPTYTFTPSTTISSSEVNANFALLANALNRTGGTITGNITVSAGITIDGIDLSAWLNQAVLTSSSPTFAGLTVAGSVSVTGTGNTVTVAGTGAGAIDVAGGINAGSGNVGIVGTDGRIPAISSTYFASLAGTNLTGVALLGSVNAFTARNDLLTYSETKAAPTISGNALTLDLATASHFTVALNANITTLTISNTPSSPRVTAFTVAFTADGSVRTITWPASVKWPNGTAPTMTGTNTYIDIIQCVTYDAGTAWLCAVGGQAIR